MKHTPTHTPGPWKIVGPYVAVDNAVVCRYCDNSQTGPYWVASPADLVATANAHLIAAAPDLLAEAKADLSALIELRDKHLAHAAAVVRALVQKRIDATQAAIAKATGEA